MARHLTAIVCAGLLAAGVVVAVLGLGTAHSQTDAIKARKDNFHALSDQMRDIVKGLGDGLPVSAMQDRVAAADQALQRVPHLFPPGSERGRTNALPLIWADPAKFAAVYDAARDRMQALVAAAARPDRDAFGAAVGRMAAACGTCHATFRAQ